MHILNLNKIKCNILHKLRHTWIFVVFVAKVLDNCYRSAINQLDQPQAAHHNNNNSNNNNNVMEQEIPDDAPEELQPPQQQQEQLNQAQDDFEAFFNYFAPPEPMDASDVENEDANGDADADVDELIGINDDDEDEDEDDDDDDDDVDVDDDNDVTDEDESDPELEEMYSDGDWTTSNDESEISITVSNVGLGPAEPAAPRVARPLYSFQPARLVKCQFKEKHCIGGFPLGRSGHRIIASKSHLYSLGGYNPRSALTAARRGRCLLFQELWSYNFATNHWVLELNADNAIDMPTELASNALAIHNDVLISHGGTGYPFGELCSNDCYVYRTNNARAGVECLKVSGDLPTAQYGPGIVIHKHYLYTIGGTTGFDYSCDVYRLDLHTKVWENVYICRPEMRDDPEGRYRHEVVYDGKHIFVLGGGTSNSVYDLQRIPAYNLDVNRWDYFDTLPDRQSCAWSQDNRGYPKPRKCFSCVQHQSSNGDIEAFITGGLQGDFSTYFSDIWKLNLRTKQWSIIQTASLPRPLYFHSAAHSDNGCMYIFGGIEYNDKETLKRRNDLYKMWMTIPKLSEMCWDAITYYNDNLDLYHRKTLLSAGIPKSFTDRLPPQRLFSDKGEPGTSTVTSLYSIAKRPRSQLQ